MSFLLFVHVVAAAVALLTLWLPLVAKKGGRAHRRIGIVYVWSMSIASAGAMILSAVHLLRDDAHERTRTWWFFLYISLLSLTSLSIGMRALRTKARTTASRHPIDVGLPSLLAISGVALFVYARSIGAPLLMAFAPVGIIVGSGQLAFWLRAPKSKMAWWFEHMGGMFASGIAATTAFFVVNASRLGLPRSSLYVWLAPTVIGVPTLILWQQYYHRKFAPREPAPSASTPAPAQ